MSKPRKKYNPRKCPRPSYETTRLTIGKALIIPTKDLDLLNQPDADYQALIAGNATVEGFTRLCEMATALFCIGRLLKERGAGDTALIGWSYEETGNQAADALEAIATRYRETGRLVGTGDEYRRVKESLTALRTVIPVLTRGEFVTALHEAACIVEDAMKNRDERRLADEPAMLGQSDT